MANQVEVSDSTSNVPEQIEHAALTIGRSSARLQVFSAIYHHKSKIKTVGQIAQRTSLPRMRVLQEGRYLHQKGLVRQTKKDGETAYEKIDFFHVHKAKILSYVARPAKLKQLPTRRRPSGSVPKFIRLPSAGAKVSRITIDDIASFSAVRKIGPSGMLPANISENVFKRGVQSIIGETGVLQRLGR